MITAASEFAVERLGVIMSSLAGEPKEAWGVLNPGGVRSPDGDMHVFPRLIAEGNLSRIGHARVRFVAGIPVGVDRLGMALQPQASYEVGPLGGGVEDPRVVYLRAIDRYVMTYTAFVPFEPRVAVAVSTDLLTWQRLGLVRYEPEPHVPDLNKHSNKDAAFLSDVVSDPEGVPSLAMLHRPTTRVRIDAGGSDVTSPPSGQERGERIWMSYIPLTAVRADVGKLTTVRRHERVMAPEQSWEMSKIGTGPPPVRLSYGWLLLYHAVSSIGGRLRYCMGAAILDLDRPAKVLYRTAEPILEPREPYEVNGLVSNVIFPTATDLHAEGPLDVYYGAADRVIAVARLTLPRALPKLALGAIAGTGTREVGG